MIAKNVDLFDTKATLLHILKLTRQTTEDGKVTNYREDLKNQELSKGYIRRIINYYSAFCQSNQIPMDRPKLKHKAPIPIIPTTEQVKTIISCAYGKYTVIFTILSETAIEGEELHQIPNTQINREEGIISVCGTKGHANGVYKLKPQTAEMLRHYLAKHPHEEYPFPCPKNTSEAWRGARRLAVKRYCKPELYNIPLKNLRNYAGAQFYLNTGKHDPIATMRFMRHSRLETTLHYIRSINLDEPVEYKTVAIKLGEPDTRKQILEHLNAGYTRETEADG